MGLKGLVWRQKKKKSQKPETKPLHEKMSASQQQNKHRPANPWNREMSGNLVRVWEQAPLSKVFYEKGQDCTRHISLRSAECHTPWSSSFYPIWLNQKKNPYNRNLTLTVSILKQKFLLKKEKMLQKQAFTKELICYKYSEVATFCCEADHVRARACRTRPRSQNLIQPCNQQRS